MHRQIKIEPNFKQHPAILELDISMVLTSRRQPPAILEPAMAGSQAASPSSHLHVVVFPWLAFGHVSTPRNAARLGAVTPELSALVRVAALELPQVEGLPDGAESTADVPPEKVGLLKKAFDGLAAPFAQLVAEACAGGCDEVAAFSRSPDWIVFDFAQNWIWPIAEEHEVGSLDRPSSSSFRLPWN